MVKYALEIGPGESPAKQAGDGYMWAVFEHPTCFSTFRHDAAALWGEKPLAAADDVFDLVYASHVLEHIPWTRTQDALREAHRVLKPGGLIELWVPDFAYLVWCYRNEKCGDEWRHENPDNDFMKWLNGRLFTYGPEPNFHKATFDFSFLRQHLLKAGFRTIERIHRREKPRGHDHGRINLGVRAVK